MATDIHKLIAAIVPDIYCIKSKVIGGETIQIRSEVKKIAKEKGYLEAAKIAEPVASEFFNFENPIKNIISAKALSKSSPIEKHYLLYETLGGNLEPIYFWILDRINAEYDGKTYKLVDNFVSSAGSSFFAEMGGRATRMQEEGMKILGAVNQVIKSILNIVYDLKEFKMRLSVYDNYKSSDKNKKDSALMSLKQIWLDTVDIKRGNTSIKGLALGNQSYFVTLIDAFMASDSLEAVQKLDLNDRVKRILEQRLPEFQEWLKQSELELRKRFELEKAYLRSQYNTVQLYARWAKPYLLAAKNLESRAAETSSFVHSFNTTLLELSIMGTKKYDIMADIFNGELPKEFAPSKYKQRTYYETLLVDFKFRSIPEKSGQSHVMRGTAELTFTSYALNDDEIKILRDLVEKDNFGDVLGLIEGATTQSLETFKEDIDEFLEGGKIAEAKKEEEEKKAKEEKRKNLAAENPFVALFTFNSSKPEKKEEKKDKKDSKPKAIEPDNYVEKAVRVQTAISSRKRCLDIYELYKKLNSMPTF